ncbi:MAG: hypothetical protein GY861_12715 [bacterium]|nr:hypothetical protein [bacterium]
MPTKKELNDKIRKNRKDIAGLLELVMDCRAGLKGMGRMVKDLSARVDKLEDKGGVKVPLYKTNVAKKGVKNANEIESSKSVLTRKQAKRGKKV